MRDFVFKGRFISRAERKPRLEMVSESAKALFAVIKKGAFQISIAQTYPLRDASRAHRDLESAQDDGADNFAHE